MHNEEDSFTTFEEELLHNPSGKKRWHTESSTPPTRQEEDVKAKTLPYPGQIMRIQNPPAGWIGNFKKDHDHEADPCMCHRCYMSAYPFLEARDPVQVHPQYPLDAPAMQAMVGLYDSRIAKQAVPCEVCKALIKITESFGVDTELTVIHVRCLPEEEQLALGRIGYAPAYIIRHMEKVIRE